ncbi:MAG TPA: addiction module protein [Terriglobia bacterium]|nr:addiction module protein [Terriglobia bacterium]
MNRYGRASGRSGVGRSRLFGCRAFAYNALMSTRAQELLRKTLTLSPNERADVAAELLASLDEPTDDIAEVEKAWAVEIERRARRVLSGESAGEPWEEVRERIARRLMK